MSVEFLVRAILIASLALLTSACGGGGGGSGATVVQSDTDSGTGEPYVFTRTQFEYLPFTGGTSIQYDDDTESSVTLDTNDFAGKGVYAIENDGTTLYFSTTETKIAFHGADGSIEKNGITITKLRFRDSTGNLSSIPMLYSNTPEGTNAIFTELTTKKAEATTNNFLIGTVDVQSLEVTSIFENTEPEPKLDYGLLPTRKLTFTIQGIVQLPAILDQPPFSVTFTDTLYLTSGIGIVKHESTDYGINNEIVSLTGLPTTIWFNNAADTPIIDSESDPTFSIAGIGAISSTTYRVANIDALNEIPWLSIQEDTASNTFNVGMTPHEDLPATLTSVEVIFENKETEERLSGNVTIQPLN